MAILIVQLFVPINSKIQFLMMLINIIMIFGHVAQIKGLS